MELEVPPPSSPMKEEEEEEEAAAYSISKPSDLTTTLISLQADIIYNAVVFLFSPVATLLCFASETHHLAQQTKSLLESTLHRAPAHAAHRLRLWFRRLSRGILAAAYMGLAMAAALLVGSAVGVGLVRFWVEEPVFVRERVYFDYSQPHPQALLSSIRHGSGDFLSNIMDKRMNLGVPVGHTFQVSLLLVMPDSDFNRRGGVFQVTTELLSDKGEVITRSSRPCMMRYQSLPVRLTRTFLMAIPLVLGISSETQSLTIDILRHKEGHPRSGSIRVNLLPRAGTSTVAALYEAEIVIKSQLPRLKEFVHKWKWTCYIWSSFYFYILFLVAIISWWKPLYRRVEEKEEKPSEKEEMESTMAMMSELLTQLHRIRSKRKAIAFDEQAGSSFVSSITFGGDDLGLEADSGDSELTQYEDGLVFG